ncbi:DUF2786 domain-containing protein [Actinomadura luteofluorescens]|uniref:DUF2786 domain-containing protein n=1 Tax=Actinomadura luteofluorescens TaxID=46163 RepID=UPI003D8D52B2
MRNTWRRGRTSETAAALTVDEAVRALARGESTTFQRLVGELTSRPDTPGWTVAADHCVADRLRRGITSAWQRGWQPADLVRFTTRRHTPRHARLSTDAIADEMRLYSPGTVSDRWHEQLAVLQADVWWPDDGPHPSHWCRREGVDRAVYVTCAIELIHLLETLPKLPPVTQPPGAGKPGGSEAGGADRNADSDEDSARSSRPSRDMSSGSQGESRRAEADQRILGRVRALLAKAESTEFPEEAEALSARAQELMARHSIDQALLAAETGDMGGTDGRRIAVDSPYDAPKAVLLTVVAEANHCRAIWHRELGFSTVLGFPADLAAVEILFTSLLVQGTSAMVHAGPRRDARGRSRTRSFRHAFLNAYAVRIGERLRGAADRAAADAGGKDLLPVLAARDQAVDQAVDTMFPNLAKGRAGSVSNYEGWVAGRAAADLASLNGRSEVTGAFRGP